MAKSLRQREINRVLAYAKGLGISVEFKPHKDGSPGAEYHHLPPSITVYTYPGQSKTRVILNLLHELGHHLDWIYKGKRIAKADIDALHKDNTRSPGDKPLPRRLRERIYKSEHDGTAYVSQIAKELDLKLPKWKVRADVDCDRWVAAFYLETGEYPSERATKSKLKELRQIHKENQ